MTLQVLVATRNQTDHSLLERMKIQTDAVVVNQADHDSIEVFAHGGNKIKWINMSARGVGLSRNTALMNASADIVLFADDDLIYNAQYGAQVLQAFTENIDADVMCFNINLVNSNKNIGGHRHNKKNRRLRFYNSMRYGACLIAARRRALLRERISFSLLFGGGAEFNSGEDSIFIKDCLDTGLHLYSNTFFWGDVDDSQSSWYTGINDRFFVERGMALASAFPKIYLLIFIYYSYKLRRLDRRYTCANIFSLMLKGKSEMSLYR